MSPLPTASVTVRRRNAASDSSSGADRRKYAPALAALITGEGSRSSDRVTSTTGTISGTFGRCGSWSTRQSAKITVPGPSGRFPETRSVGRISSRRRFPSRWNSLSKFLAAWRNSDRTSPQAQGPPRYSSRTSASGSSPLYAAASCRSPSFGADPAGAPFGPETRYE